MQKKRGMVLIVAMGMLGVLGILAVVFMAVTNAERTVAQFYVDLRRAQMLAQSGLERAGAEMAAALLQPSVPADKYSSSEGEEKPWLFGKLGTPTTAPVFDPAIPLQEAIYVSFQGTDATGAPDFVRIENRPNTTKRALFGIATTDTFGVTGRLGATYGGGADYYSVKVLDAGGRIWINGPDLNDGNPNPAIARTVADLAPNVRMMLNTLGQILASEQGFTVANLGDQISAYRKGLARDFDTLNEIKPILGSTDNIQSRNYELVRAYVTSKAWVDRSTLDPRVILHPRPDDPNIIYNNAVTFTRADGSPEDSYAALPVERVKEPFCTAKQSLWASCGSDRLVGDDPGDWAPHWLSRNDVAEVPAPAATIGPCLQPRAPVNINSAPREVIRAVLTNLRGRYFTRAPGAPTEPRTFTGSGFKPGFEVVIDSGIAGNVADRLITHRRDLIAKTGYGIATWSHFNNFIDGIPDSVFDTNKPRAKAKKSLIKANANPNSHLNKFNPDFTFGSAYGDTDKGDLVYVNGTAGWTTEFCFASMGYFELESIGRVLGTAAPGKPAPLMAERKISTLVKVCDVYRHSTQKEFLVNRVGGGSGTGTSFTLYPENLDDVGPNLAAEYDGYVMPATTDKNAGGGGLLFRATYTNNLGADAVGPAERGVSLINPSNAGSPGGAGNGASELFCDGLFVHETRRYPNYSNLPLYGAAGFGAQDDYVRNARADQKIRFDSGSLEMWVKPTWSASEFPTLMQATVNNPQAIGSRTLFSAGDGKLGTAYGSQLGPKDQTTSDNRVALFCRQGNAGPYLFGLHATRLAEPYGWGGTIAAGPFPNLDLLYYWGKYHTNWYRLPNNPGKTNDPANWAFPGVWHHVRYVWSGGTASYLYVDGKPSGDDPVIVNLRAEKPFTASAWSLFPGTNRFRTNSTNGYVCSGDCTIDDLRTYRNTLPTSPFVPPHRYVGTAQFSAKIGPSATGGVDPLDKTLDYSGRLVSVAWTVQYPKFSGVTGSSNWNMTTVGSTPAGSPLDVVVAPGLPQELEGRGSRPQNPLYFQIGDELRYSFNLNVNSASYRMAAPILDDVTVTVVPAGGFRYLYYAVE
ncbi:MAG: hypothetical protein HYZ53_15730 [Planctomycetes bacterium]|nr:hypothetical protein [Planctomycetota bacterium]